MIAQDVFEARRSADRALADRLLHGDEQDKADVFSTLFETYQSPIYNYIYRLMGSKEDAADMTQMAFLKVWKALDKVDAEQRWSGWLYRIATNVCLDELRHRKLVKWSHIDKVFGDHFGMATGTRTGMGEHTSMNLRDAQRFGDLVTVKSVDDQPEASVLTSERQEDVQRVLDHLHPKYRMCLILREFHDLSYDEMAETLNTTRAAIKSLLYRAREEFRALTPKIAPDLLPAHLAGEVTETAMLPAVN